MHLKTKKRYKIWNEILSLLVSLIVIGVGGYLASNKWTLPFLEALGSKVVGWILLIVGGLSLIGSIGNFFIGIKTG